MNYKESGTSELNVCSCVFSYKLNCNYKKTAGLLWTVSNGESHDVLRRVHTCGANVQGGYQ